MGRVQGGMRCVKFLLFLFNFIFWFAGTAVIAFGLWLRFGNVIRDLATDEASPEYFYMGLYVLIGAGVLMMAVGFFGCCGAARESQCLLGAFFSCLLVIFAAEIAAGVFAFLGKEMAVKEVQVIYDKAYENYISDQSKNKTLIKFHDANCLTEIESLINSNLHLLGIVGIAIAGITIFGMVFSMVLCCAIRNTRDML
ncbi:tetraspanin-2 isoform X2 [Erythrolamprus reginae]|uniref:tetraspanin-2 isoform X2 n=1 Tax=Erythrolamprus reginae TaxID=121349 RepID=UPI00396CD18E